MRRWLIAAALLVFAGAAQAHVRSGVGVVGHGFHRVVASAPVLVGDGVSASLDFNFASDSFFQAGQAGTTPATLLAVTRASTKYCDDLSGAWVQVAANTLCYTNKGALIEEARTNLFLNSAAPATQTITVVNGSVYTASLIGGGTMTLSGAGSGVVSQGAPVTFTASSTSLTATVAGATGAFKNGQVELSAFATSPIVTAGASATRAADVITTVVAPAFGTSFTLYGSGIPSSPPSFANAQNLLQIDVGTNADRVLIFRQQSTGKPMGFLAAGGVTLFFVSGGNWPADSFGKVALSLANANHQLGFNGSIIASGSTAGALPAPTVVRFNTIASINQFSGYLQRVALWPATALTTGALQSITSGGGP